MKHFKYFHCRTRVAQSGINCVRTNRQPAITSSPVVEAGSADRLVPLGSGPSPLSPSLVTAKCIVI